MTAEIEPCPQCDWLSALTLLYRRVPEDFRPKLIADAIADAARGEIDLSGLWIARRRSRVVGALLTQRLPGRAAAVWAPEVNTGLHRASLAADLVRTALGALRTQGYQVAQALIELGSPRRSSADLTRGGLPRVTELTYMARETSIPLEISGFGPTFDWQSFAPHTEAAFRDVLQLTYVGSLDMPELDGIRSLDDVLASHHAGGRFQAERWCVGFLRGEPESAAIVLLSNHLDRDTWEVAYLGLTPHARGRGLGRVALAHALDLARPHSSRLELAVDARNIPAARLYQAAGFTAFDRRVVHVSVLRTAPGYQLRIAE
jgi:mycothiol synthase